MEPSGLRFGGLLRAYFLPLTSALLTVLPSLLYVGGHESGVLSHWWLFFSSLLLYHGVFED